MSVLHGGSGLLILRDMRDPMHLTLTLDSAKTEYRSPFAFAARMNFSLRFRAGL